MAREKKKDATEGMTMPESPSDPWGRKTITISLSSERRALLRSVLPESEIDQLSPADVIYHLIDLLQSSDADVELPTSKPQQVLADDRLDRLEENTRQSSEAVALCAESLKQIAASMESLQKMVSKASGSGPAQTSQTAKPHAPIPANRETWMGRVLSILKPASHAEIRLDLKLASMVEHDDQTASIRFDVSLKDQANVALPGLRLKPMPKASQLAKALMAKPIPRLCLSCKSVGTVYRAKIHTVGGQSEAVLLEMTL